MSIYVHFLICVCLSLWFNMSQEQYLFPCVLTFYRYTYIYLYIYIRSGTENMKSLRETLDVKIFQLLMIITLIPTFALVNFTIPKTDIVHTRSGFILHYLSQYQPSNKIVTFTVTIPMVKDVLFDFNVINEENSFM